MFQASKYQMSYREIIDCDNRSECKLLFPELETDWMPQAGMVGRNYHNAEKKVLILGQNPGTRVANGKPHPLNDIHDEMIRLCDDYILDPTDEKFGTVMDFHIDVALPAWPIFKYLNLKGNLGLTLDEIAYTNLLHCQTAENAKPTTAAFTKCHDLCTAPLINVLNPDVIICLGKKTWEQFTAVSDFPADKVAYVLHPSGIYTKQHPDLQEELLEQCRNLLKALENIGEEENVEEAEQEPKGFFSWLKSFVANKVETDNNMETEEEDIKTEEDEDDDEIIGDDGIGPSPTPPAEKKYTVKEMFVRLGEASGRDYRIKNDYKEPEKIILLIDGENALPYWSGGSRVLSFRGNGITRYLPADIFPGKLDNKGWYSLNEKFNPPELVRFLEINFALVAEWLKNYREEPLSIEEPEIQENQEREIAAKSNPSGRVMAATIAGYNPTSRPFVTSCKAKVVSRNSEIYTLFSWVIIAKNPLNEEVDFYPDLHFMDEDGFSLHTEGLGPLYIGPGHESEYKGTANIDAQIASQITGISIEF